MNVFHTIGAAFCAIFMAIYRFPEMVCQAYDEMCELASLGEQDAINLSEPRLQPYQEQFLRDLEQKLNRHKIKNHATPEEVKESAENAFHEDAALHGNPIEFYEDRKPEAGARWIDATYNGRLIIGTGQVIRLADGEILTTTNDKLRMKQKTTSNVIPIVRTGVGTFESVPAEEPIDFLRIASNLSVNFKMTPEEEIQALRDMLDDARAELTEIREAIGVAYEPHQNLRERTIERAKSSNEALRIIRQAGENFTEWSTWAQKMAAWGMDCDKWPKPPDNAPKAPPGERMTAEHVRDLLQYVFAEGYDVGHHDANGGIYRDAYDLGFGWFRDHPKEIAHRLPEACAVRR